MSEETIFIRFARIRPHRHLVVACMDEEIHIWIETEETSTWEPKPDTRRWEEGEI